MINISIRQSSFISYFRDETGRGRKTHQIDPEAGAILGTIESNRVFTGVTWIDGELGDGTWD